MAVIKPLIVTRLFFFNKIHVQNLFTSPIPPLKLLEWEVTLSKVHMLTHFCPPFIECL